MTEITMNLIALIGFFHKSRVRTHIRKKEKS